MGGRFLAWVARGRMLLRNMVLAWRRDDGLLKPVKSFSCAGVGGSAGLRPAPARRQGQSQSQNGSGFLWVGRGGVGLRGRRKPVHGGLAAASMPRTPRNPTPPHLRQLPGDGWIDPGTTWGRGGQIRFPLENGSDPNRFRYLIEIHPRMAWIYRSRKSVEGGVGPVAGVSAAWMPRPSPRDGFTASPATGPTPTPRRKPASAVAVAVALAVAPACSRCRAQPCRTPPLMLRRRMHSAEPACST
ncbi:hypothetical protein NIPOLPBK_01270 [Stenotrophomonas maltophilia]|nr:hypothetical protein NIPOLPBK_01270 [Stenotrophomonas maltophilia]